MSNDEELDQALERLAAQKAVPEVKAWLEIRKEAGQKLDPKTADVMYVHAQVLDPYGVCPDFPDELYCLGRAYFARSAGSDIWVSFDDLPGATNRWGSGKGAKRGVNERS
jgi:hypothetical protein